MKNKVILTAEKVKIIRECSGAGMMDCKNALIFADGDMYLALGYLNVKGHAIHVNGGPDARKKRDMRLAQSWAIHYRKNKTLEPYGWKE